MCVIYISSTLNKFTNKQTTNSSLSSGKSDIRDEEDGCELGMN